jgi:two-component system sensor kinase FixL
VQVDQFLHDSFRLLVEVVSDYAIVMLDPDGCVVSWNNGAENISGYTYDEIIGRHVAHFFTPEDVAAGKPLRELELAAAHGRCTDEGWRVRKDGSRYWGSIVVTAIYDDAGVELLGYSKVVRDLSERRQAEQALRDSEQRLRGIVESAVDAIITIDETGLIDSVNPATAKLFGYTVNEMIGSNVNMLMPEPDRAAHDRYLADYLRTGRAKIIGIGREVRGQRKDGTTFPMQLAVSEFRLHGRRMFTGIVHDLTPLRVDGAAGCRPGSAANDHAA